VKDLILSDSKNEMSIVDIAETLNVDQSTIRKIAKKLFPDFIRNGVKTYFDEEKTTLIKLEIGKGRTDLGNISEVENKRTALEKRLLIQQAMNFLNEEVEELRIENKKQQQLLIDQSPKVEFFDMVSKSDKWITLKQVSDLLNIPEIGRNNLCKRLRDEDFLTQYNQPYQKYKNQGLFKSIESVSKSGHVSVSTVVSQKGLIKIRMVLLNPKSRNTSAYRKWKKSVFENDLYTCQKCGYAGKDIEPHHIIPWSKSVKKRFDVSNGQTLCKDCHKLEHKANG